MNAHIKYVRMLIVVAIAAAGLAATFNFLIDPYRLFGVGTRVGINALKPASAERMRVVKPYLAERFDAATVIGGNSRPELGLDTSSRCWPASHQPVFNAGIAGASFRMQALLAMHASGTTATRILHGVDFLDFIRPTDASPTQKSSEPATESAHEQRLIVPGQHSRDWDYWTQRTGDQLKALFSLTTLADSVHTIAAQRNPNASTRTASGFNPANDYLDIVRTEGQHVLFAQKNRELASRLSREYRLDPDDGTDGDGFTALRRLIDWSKSRGIELTLFINPYHAEYLEGLERSGQWQLFEQWKQLLTDIAEGGGVALWDFNTLDAYASETPPAPGDRRTILRWFWEPAHYRSSLGDVMLERMLETTCGAAADSASFGARLSSSTLLDHLASLRRHMQSRVNDGRSTLIRDESSQKQQPATR
ncbi:MAG: hypothetical protein KIT63_08430 [Rhodoferax sp.]|nr:hypothetical protein [Rhodoferax sp.]